MVNLWTVKKAPSFPALHGYPVPKYWRRRTILYLITSSSSSFDCLVKAHVTTYITITVKDREDPSSKECEEEFRGELPISSRNWKKRDVKLLLCISLILDKMCRLLAIKLSSDCSCACTRVWVEQSEILFNTPKTFFFKYSYSAVQGSPEYVPIGWFHWGLLAFCLFIEFGRIPHNVLHFRANTCQLFMRKFGHLIRASRTIKTIQKRKEELSAGFYKSAFPIQSRFIETFTRMTFRAWV